MYVRYEEGHEAAVGPRLLVAPGVEDAADGVEHPAHGREAREDEPVREEEAADRAPALEHVLVAALDAVEGLLVLVPAGARPGPSAHECKECRASQS